MTELEAQIQIGVLSQKIHEAIKTVLSSTEHTVTVCGIIHLTVKTDPETSLIVGAPLAASQQAITPREYVATLQMALETVEKALGKK